MNQDQATPLPDVKELAGIIPVNDLDTFVTVLTSWHNARMAQVRHFLTVPPGTSFEVNDQPITLTGTALEAFKLGVELCIMQLGTLPFVFETEDEAEQPISADAQG